MNEIYADFNEFAADQTLPLTCAGSQASIEALSEGLRDGEQVILSDGELAVVATVHLRVDGVWEACSRWGFVSRGPGDPVVRGRHEVADED